MDDSLFEHFFTRMKTQFVTKESLVFVLICFSLIFSTLFYLDSNTSNDLIMTQVNIQSNQLNLISSPNVLVHKRSFEYETSQKILLFNPLKLDKSWRLSEGNEEFHSRNCEWQNCFITSNQHQLGMERLDLFDAILFNLDHKLDLLQRTDTNWHTRYIAYFESTFWKGDPDWIKNGQPIVNWTLSHFDFADFKLDQGYFLTTKEIKSDPFMDRIREEKYLSKLLVVDHTDCDGFVPEHVHEYLEFMKEYIDVHEINSCNSGLPHYMSTSEVATQFKFVLIYDLDLCHGSMNRKFYQYLSLDIVPTVLSISSKYQDAAAPLNAHLTIADFSSAQDLTNHLKEMDQNMIRYYEYFQWKEEFEIRPIKNSMLPLCDLCQKLHQDLPRKEYPDFQEWIRDQMICIDYSILPWFKQETDVTTILPTTNEPNEQNEQNQVHEIIGNLVRIFLYKNQFKLSLQKT